MCEQNPEEGACTSEDGVMGESLSGRSYFLKAVTLDQSLIKFNVPKLRNWKRVVF